MSIKETSKEKSKEKIKEKILNLAKAAKKASFKLTNISPQLKNSLLATIKDKIQNNINYILEENQKDIEINKDKLSPALLDRLTLNHKRIFAMLSSIDEIIKQKDVIGQIQDMWKVDSGLLIGKMRVPLGVVCVVYESRPNVTVDAAVLCLKSSNSSILKGGREAIHSNKALVNILQSALVEHNLPKDCTTFVDIIEKEAVRELAQLPQYIDVMILRGGRELMESVGRSAIVEVIFHGEGNCHIYIEEDADLVMAQEIVFNAKTQRPGVCNAVESLLVNKNIAQSFLPIMIEKLKQAGVVIKGCPQTRKIVQDIEPATEEDWYKEYLDLILSIKVVKDIDEAIWHINTYGSHHSDAIITNSYEKALKFTREVDSAAVYVNASTRFTDGYEFGLGGEIGISTQKLHARGPMSIGELTTYKFVIFGQGQVRK